MKYLTLTLLLALAVPAFAAAPVSPQNAPESIKTALDVVWELSDKSVERKVDLIESCESGGKDVSIIDTNGLESAGVLQFQFPTFVHYMEIYNLAPEAEITDYRNLYRDTRTQRYLAYTMIKNDPTALYNWKNCAVKVGLIQ